MKSILLTCLLALGCGVADGAVFIHFDEQPTQSADGLTVNGVVFGFTVSGSPSTDAIFNEELPVTTVNLDDRVLAGPVGGQLRFLFLDPTAAFQFALVLNTLDAEQPGASVELFDPNAQSLGVLPLDTNPLLTFSEGLFTYAGPAVSQVVITFSGSTAANIFAVDNLQYDSDVPEAGSLLLCGLGLAGLGLARMRYGSGKA